MEEEKTVAYLERKVRHISENHVHIPEAEKYSYILKKYECLGKQVSIKEKVEATLGTGQKVWDCSLVLAKYLEKLHLSGKSLLENKVVVDMGCGTGYLSIVSSILGASKVYGLDLPEVLEGITKMNLGLNHEIPLGNVELIPFNWTWPDSTISEFMKALKINLILCSDVIFNKEQLGRVPGALRAMIKNREQEAIVLLSYRDRTEEISDKLYEEFSKHGFEGEQLNDAEYDNDFKAKDIDVFLICDKNHYKPSNLL